MTIFSIYKGVSKGGKVEARRFYSSNSSALLYMGDKKSRASLPLLHAQSILFFISHVHDSSARQLFNNDSFSQKHIGMRCKNVLSFEFKSHFSFKPFSIPRYSDIYFCNQLCLSDKKGYNQIGNFGIEECLIGFLFFSKNRSIT